jgi:hypothetical protein
MHSNSTTPHATHDELLLARLYGGDLDERDRARALDLVAACEECAGLFADLGAIATATAAMAVPPRPRGFTLSEADAARLRRRSNGGSLRGLFGWTRALGGSMAAIGLVGVVALGVISAFGTGSAMAPQSDHGALTAASQVTSQALPGYLYGSPTSAEWSGGGDKQSESTGALNLSGSPFPSPVSTGAAAASPASAGSLAAISVTCAPAPAASPASGGTSVDGSLDGPTGPTADGHDAGSPAPASSDDSFTSKSIGGGPGSGGPDAWTIALAGSVGLLALGLLVLAAPRLAARRARH